MNIYFFYVHDRRYSIPQFIVVETLNDDRAVEIAREYLAELSDYLSVDILEGEREVARVEP